MAEQSPWPDPASGPGEHEHLISRFGRRFQAGDVLFVDGDQATEAYLLQDGRVRLLKRVGALERSLRLLGPGDLFGESALMPGALRNSTAVALSEGAALVLDSETFQHVLRSNPAVGTRVLSQLIRRLRDAEDQIEIMMVRDTQSKIAVALLKLAHQCVPDAGGGTGPLALLISPLDLSSRVGLDVETVKRGVAQLRESGYVRIVDEKLQIQDLEALTELVSLLNVKDEILGAESSPPTGSRSRSRNSP
jgi:CRP/FNR family transcriptional regulator, cyclic AMP receptor protein